MQIVSTWLQKRQLDWSEIAYIGADVADIKCMEACAFSAAPRNASSQVKAVADVVLDASGGDGVLNELSELLISHSIVPA